jgi:hypothetical protein
MQTQLQTRLQTEGACPNADFDDDTEEEISSTPDQSAEKPVMEKPCNVRLVHFERYHTRCRGQN